MPVKTNLPLLIVVWLVVLIPALWGVEQTARKSVPLFTAINKSPSGGETSPPPATMTAESAATAPSTVPSLTPATSP